MTLAQRYADMVVRLRWFVLIGWVGVAVSAMVYLPDIDETGGGGLGGFVEADNPAVQAEIRSYQKFLLPVFSRTAVVQRNPEGLSALAQLRVFTAALAFNLDKPPELQQIEGALPVTNSFGLVPGSREVSTTAITYLFFRPEVSFQKQTELARAFAARYANEPSDHLVGVTGVVPARTAQLRALERHLPTVEIVTVGVVFLIVALTFRSLGAACMTLGTAAVGLVVVLRTAGWLGQRLGVAVPGELEPVLVALLLGVITDYSIFFLSGMRESMAGGADRLLAARRSTGEFGPIVLVAAVTVAGGCLALLAATLGLFRTFGPGMALTIVIALAVAITLVPACLAIFGKALLWPSRVAAAHGPAPSGAPPSALTRLVTHRPLPVVGVCAGLMVALALPLRNIELGLGVIESLPAGTEAARAADAAAQGFSPGTLSPTIALVEGPGVTRQRLGLERLEELIEAQPGVKAIVGPREQPSPISLGAVLSTTGDAARYVVTLDSPPLSGTAIDHVTELRKAMPRLLRTAGITGAEAHLVGDSAVAEAIVTQTQQDIGRIAAVAMGAGFLLLVVFLRAVVAPLYLMATNALALVATLGLTTLVFQGMGGHAGITFYVPLAASVLLVSLGSDYNIFGVGYIWAEARRRSLRDAIIVALPRSSRAISAAGVTLAASFAVLGMVPLVPFREFAFAMGAGILIDVFVVRSLLVPALLSLVGPVSAWPGRLLTRPAVGSGSAGHQSPQARERRSRRPHRKGPVLPTVGVAAAVLVLVGVRRTARLLWRIGTRNTRRR